MSQQSTGFNCEHANTCSGCGWFRTPYVDQRRLKLEAFIETWLAAGLPRLGFDPKFVSIAESGLRDRVDLVIDNRTGQQRLGLYDQQHKEIVDLKNCPQLTPPLQRWLNEFRTISWPINRGSVRLRVSPSGERGVWLDFANEDVKTLFDESSILEGLLAKSFVEIGQRRKRLIKVNERLKLSDPVMNSWFETYIGAELKPVPLFCNVGSFTQPGFKANHALVSEVLELCKNVGADNIAEFGSGVGNFTLPLADRFAKIEAFEVDRLACEALSANLKRCGLEHKVVINQGDYQNLSERRNIKAETFDLVFVDPPRSGLKNFLNPFFETQTKPKIFIYVSCYPESFCLDSGRLYQLGYTLESITIIDQFPQTSHAEIAAKFSRR